MTSMTTTTFADLGTPPEIVDVLAERGIHTPFPIQAATIPDGLAGRDVCGRAPTGSGKTLAFGIPMLARIDRAEPHHPRALVLAPTRELAEQIHAELAPLASALDVRIAPIYGGVAYQPQRKALRRGVEVLVATPGRLADLMEQGEARLDQVELVVVDEADRMADMGFLPEVKWILNRTAPGRQTLLFSATLDGDVAALTHYYQNDPVRHEVGAADPEGSDARHFFWRVGHTDRLTLTAEVIRRAHPTIVFCETRAGVDRVTTQLRRLGVETAAIHGGRPQEHRNRALDRFVQGRVDALVATDVAARGIHVDGVAAVVHFDPPKDTKAYLHRSGRTARAGAAGVVVTLVRDDQSLPIHAIQRQLGLPIVLHEPDVSSLDTGGDRIPAERPVQPRSGARKRSRRRRRLL